MISKKEFFKWKMVTLIDDVKYKHISFVTTYYFLGIPIYSFEKYVPNKVDTFEIGDDSGFIDPSAIKKTGTYSPSKDEHRKLLGEIDNSFD